MLYRQLLSLYYRCKEQYSIVENAILYIYYTNHSKVVLFYV